MNSVPSPQPRLPTLQLRHLAALAQDLELAKRHRQYDKVSFALDANVMWFLQRQLDEQDNNVRDYVAAAIGLENTLSLIRFSIDRLSQTTGGYLMLASHKYEIDVAFASQFPRDYDGLRETVSEVIKRVVSQHSSSLDALDLSRRVVRALKENHQEKFRFLIDIISRREERLHCIDRMTRTLPAPDYERVPPDLKKALDLIGFILQEGDRRAAFSVIQDLKALKNIAIRNAKNTKDRTVLLTFDKKLLHAVRLVQSWNKSWSGFMDVQSCQTLWIHDLLGNKTGFSSAFSLDEVMEDFRLKAKQILLPNISEDFSTPWLLNTTTLDVLQRRLKSNDSREEPEFKEELSQRIEETLEKRASIASLVESGQLEIITKAGRSFFSEVEQIIPTYQMVATDAADHMNVLETFLCNHGLEKESFLLALNKEIQQHAKMSLRILGASSLVAPKTIKAVHDFAENIDRRHGQRFFVHRFPLPIQSDEVNVDEIVRLVSNNQDVETKYEELIKMAAWEGLIADLTVAYLFACSGSWPDAEELCRSVVSSSERRSGSSAILHEGRLLLAGILRIYRTSPKRLDEADRFLEKAMASGGERPQGDRLDFRLKLEEIAVNLNRLLLEIYGASLSSSMEQMHLRGGAVNRITESLILLKNDIDACDSVSEPLRQKLNANININICLAVHFVGRDPTDINLPDNLHRRILSEIVTRLHMKAARLSFFEQIIGSFAVLARPDLATIEGLYKLEIMGSLRERLSRVLQRDGRINDFEYKICRVIWEKQDDFTTE